MNKPNLNNFGKNLKAKQRNIKPQQVFTEKDIFIESINMFYDSWVRSNKTYDLFKINLLEYEEPFYQIIEGFILLKYGSWKTEIILWYIFAREDENGEVLPLTLQIKDKEEEEVYLRTPSDLWDFLLKIEENENPKDK